MGVPPVIIGPHPYLFLAPPNDFETKGTVLLGCICAKRQTKRTVPLVCANFCVVGFVRWGYFLGDNNFWGWCYVIGLEFVCACARMVTW